MRNPTASMMLLVLLVILAIVDPGAVDAVARVLESLVSVIGR